MKISYFISVPSFKSTAFVVWILARGKFTPPPPPHPPCFKATPCMHNRVNLDRCMGSFKNLNDLSIKVFVSNKTYSC